MNAPHHVVVAVNVENDVEEVPEKTTSNCELLFVARELSRHVLRQRSVPAFVNSRLDECLVLRSLFLERRLKRRFSHP
jgi:hypothetical protein